MFASESVIKNDLRPSPIQLSMACKFITLITIVALLHTCYLKCLQFWSLNHKMCFLVLTGIEQLPQASTTEVVATTQVMSADEDDERGETRQTKTKIVLTYALPIICAVLGTAVVVVIVLAGCYLRRLRKRSRCVGVALGVDSFSDNKYIHYFPHMNRDYFS